MKILFASRLVGDCSCLSVAVIRRSFLLFPFLSEPPLLCSVLLPRALARWVRRMCMVIELELCLTDVFAN